MALRATHKSAIFFNVLLCLSFLLVICMAEGRINLGIGFGRAPTPVCTKVYGAEIGDTCFSVTQKFNLTAEFFNAINPNLNCDKIFQNEWLCIVGSAN